METIFTIDLGTSGPKVSLITPEGNVLHCVKEPTKLILLPNGGAEQSPKEWWQAIINATHRIWNESEYSPKDVSALSCTAQWSGTVAVNKDGDFIHNAIIWMDSRGAPYIQNIINGIIKIEGYALSKIISWIRKTGGAPGKSGKDSIAHILYLKNVKPNIYQQTYKFLEPKDYINLKLTGLFASSYETLTLHWVTDTRDINNINYDTSLLNRCNIDRNKLPDLYPSTHILGELLSKPAKDLQLPPGLPVVTGTPDVQAAAIGSGAINDFVPHICIGTSSWLTCHLNTKKTDLFHNMASLPSGIPGKYFIANEQETSGVCLDFLIKNVMGKHLNENEPIPEFVYNEINAFAEQSPPGNDGLIFLPWLYGERTPVEDPNIRGGFYNLSLNHTQSHLVRAVMEGVALNTRWLLKYVEKFAKRRMDNINLIGGGAESEIWCQIMADVLNRSIQQVKSPIHAGTRGAAAIASVALGKSTFEQYAVNTQIANVYTPNPNCVHIYHEYFKIFINIYKKNKKIHSILNKKTSL